MAKEPRVSIKIDGDSSGYRRAIRDAEKTTDGFGRKAKKSWDKIGAGLGGYAQVAQTAMSVVQDVFAYGKIAFDAYANEAGQYAKLVPVLTKALGVQDEYATQLLDTASAMQYQSMFADDELRPALATLAGATGDANDAFTLLHAAMDLATARGVPLSNAAKAIAGAAAGTSTALLTKLVPGLDATSLKGKSAAEIAAILEGKFGGVDTKASNTAQGGMKKLNDAVDDVAAAFGKELAPKLEEFATWLSSPEGAQALDDFITKTGQLADSLGDVADKLGTIFDWLGKLQDFGGWGLLSKIRDELTKPWQPGGPWGPSVNGAAPASSASTYANRPQTRTTLVQLDGITLARAVERASQADAARGGMIRPRRYR